MAVKVRKSRRPTREVIVCFRVSAAECNSIKALGAQRGLKKSTSPNRICLCLDRSSTTPQTKEITRDFQRHLAAENSRRGFSLVTSRGPKAWKDE
jgi:hypothetical protein